MANWATHNNWDPARYPPAAHPPELLAEVVRRFGPPLTLAERHVSTFAHDRRLHRRAIDNVARKGDLCRWLFGQRPFDLMVAVFAESHAAGHQFWKYRPGGPEPDGPLTHAIRDVYQAIDREVGRLLEVLPADANVFVVSSVGMEDDYPTTGLVDDFCRRLGYRTDRPPGRRGRRPIDLARRLLPAAVRTAVSRRLLSRDRRERLLADQFRTGTDWSRTTAFAIPATYTSLIRVNLRGREPQGTVDPGAGYEAVLARLEADFAQLRDADTGEPVVARVSRAADLFGGGPPAVLPDLFVDWRPGKFYTRVRHPKADLTQTRPDFYRVSDHSAEGFFAAAGPGVSARGEQPPASVLDFAPTFLELLGRPVPPDLTGRRLGAAAG